MSKKRISTESENDEKTSEDLETPVQRKANAAKREKLDSESDTTIEDLPFELLEFILVKAVVMEVKDMKLAKSVWKEKADLVMNRLRTVCSQWSNILTTKSFRTKLHRILDATAQTIRLEILNELPISSTIEATTTLKDEIFMLHVTADGDCVISVYDRNDLEIVKDVIPLPSLNLVYLTSCNVSNCLYVSFEDKNYNISVLRISRESDVEPKFKILPWKNDDQKMSIDKIRICANGSVMILTEKHGQYPSVVSLYNADGSLQHETLLPLDSLVCKYWDIFQKATGNLVVVFVRGPSYGNQLMEIDMSGIVERRYSSLLKFSAFYCVGFAENCDRIIISDPREGIELLDSEFNLLGLYSVQQDVSKIFLYFDFHYDSERKEIACIGRDVNARTSVITTFRFIMSVNDTHIGS